MLLFPSPNYPSSSLSSLDNVNYSTWYWNTVQWYISCWIYPLYNRKLDKLLLQKKNERILNGMNCIVLIAISLIHITESRYLLVIKLTFVELCLTLVKLSVLYHNNQNRWYIKHKILNMLWITFNEFKIYWAKSFL